ncbi:hypothetical protein [Sphingomonas aerophila]|uniref:Uncharacterized protein n=1 Tax=Sphingomonas aerophila TaxID=1344948 RepID=A0A7W9BET3_9SPHN|nr:hypothetical protein [Sphingomonas aerophila]MBB5715887.1 hypothetical protein [Sphingomonas aerophila]
MIAVAVMLAIVGVSQAQMPAGSSAAESSKQFSLDLGGVPQDDRVTAPANVPTVDPAATALQPSEPVGAPTTAGASVPLTPPALFDLDTPIAQLIASPQARAVLDKDLPGLSTDESLPKFQALSLRRFQPLTGGQLSDDLLSRTAADLAAIEPSAPGKGRNASR